MKRVRAVELGFYDGQMKHAGAEFDVPDTFKGKWFVLASEPAEPIAPDPSDKPIALSELRKMGGNPKSFIEQMEPKNKKK